MELTIKIDDVVTWASRDVEFELNLGDVPKDRVAELVAKAAVMGFRKAGVDAAASAAKYAKDNDIDVEQATRELTEKKIAVWLAGDWGAERGGDGMTRVERRAIGLCREAVRTRDPKAYKSWDESERFATCVEYFEALPDKQKADLLRAGTELVRIADEAKAAREALGDLGIKL